MHFWAHLYFFTGAAALFLEGEAPLRAKAFVVLRLVALACAIELLQTRAHWNALEVSDLACDLAGIGTGLLIGLLRSGAHLPLRTLRIGDLRAPDLLG